MRGMVGEWGEGVMSVATVFRRGGENDRGPLCIWRP